MKSIVCIVDGNYFVNYASHAAVADLQGPHGEPTGALHVFLNTLWGINQKIQGSMIVVFDGGHAAFRNKLYPDYKNRDKGKGKGKDATGIMMTEEELDKKEMIENMKGFAFKTLDVLLPAMGIPSLRIPNEEADDIIYVLTKLLTKESSVYCVTSDEDFVQMVKLGASVYLYRQDEHLTANNFKSKYKFGLDGFTLYKAMKGDTSDNIGGVPGIGKVNATKIINSLSEPTLSALFDFCSGSDDKKHQAVIQHFKVIKRNIRLMDLEYIEVDEDEVIQLFEEAKDEAVLDFPYVKKIFYELGLQTAGSKWLTNLLSKK